MGKTAVIGIVGMSVFMSLERFPKKGETLKCDGIYEEIGGKGFNQALAVKMLGGEVSFLTAVGDDSYGEITVSEIKKHLPGSSVCVKKGEASAFAVILTDKNGENQVIGTNGASLTEEDVLSFEKEIASCDNLLLQLEVPDKVNEKAIELAEKYNKRVILNPAPAYPLSEKLKKAWLITPNEEEAKIVCEEEFERTIVTLGEKGARLKENGKIDMLPPVKVAAVDTTGAGDCFNGALAYYLASGKELYASAVLANEAAAKSVTGKGIIESYKLI